MSSIIPPLRALARERYAQEIALAMLRGGTETPSAQAIKRVLAMTDEALKPDA